MLLIYQLAMSREVTSAIWGHYPSGICGGGVDYWVIVCGAVGLVVEGDNVYSFSPHCIDRYPFALSSRDTKIPH